MTAASTESHSIALMDRLPWVNSQLQLIQDRLSSQILGQDELIRSLVISLLAEGHILLEGVPGLAKTKAVHALADVLGLPFRRISFTPDLLPADLIGTQIYRPSTGEFDLQLGPIHTSLLLADEINRAPAKVQSALLEAMQDRRVTIGQRMIQLPSTFWVLATQNPIEQEGTYPLPEAQLDRFLMKLVVSYPSREAEIAILALSSEDLSRDSDKDDGLSPPIPPGAIAELRQLTRHIYVAPALRAYLVDLIRATRDPRQVGLEDLVGLIELGASPRSSQALFGVARASALLEGRHYATPHDVKSMAPAVLRHRIIPSFEADAEGLSAEDLLERILQATPVP